MTRGGIIDAHAHVFRPASIYPRGVDELAPADRDAPVEDLLELMAGGGVDGAVLVPLDANDDYNLRPRFENPFPESTVQQVLQLSEASGIHLMVSGQYALSTQEPPYPDLFQVTRRFAGAYGPERLMWASDYPWTRDVPGYGTLLDLVSAALPDLDAEGLAHVLGGTARKLFPHLAGEPSSETTARIP